LVAYSRCDDWESKAQRFSFVNSGN
jgi:hypothetical protein